jgi:hypothetical protein
VSTDPHGGNREKGDATMPTTATKKPGKRAKHLKKGKKLEAARPLTDSALPKLYNLTGAGSHLPKVYVG